MAWAAARRRYNHQGRSRLAAWVSARRRYDYQGKSRLAAWAPVRRPYDYQGRSNGLLVLFGGHGAKSFDCLFQAIGDHLPFGCVSFADLLFDGVD